MSQFEICTVGGCGCVRPCITHEGFAGLPEHLQPSNLPAVPSVARPQPADTDATWLVCERMCKIQREIQADVDRHREGQFNPLEGAAWAAGYVAGEKSVSQRMDVQLVAALDEARAAGVRPPLDLPAELDDIIAAFVHAEDQYLGCQAATAPFWCFWNKPKQLCVECEGFKQDVGRHLSGILAAAAASRLGADQKEKTTEDQTARVGGVPKSEHGDLLREGNTPIVTAAERTDYEHARLCYVSGCFAFFTTQPLAQQIGDDWNDAPYEHNAGEPYEYHELDAKHGTPPWTIYRLAWDGPFNTPSHNVTNSRYCVDDINRGDVAWLRHYEGGRPIPAGTTVTDFRSLIQSGGGTVYESVERLPREGNQPASIADHRSA